METMFRSDEEGVIRRAGAQRLRPSPRDQRIGAKAPIADNP
jgi:hypothetical protein